MTPLNGDDIRRGLIKRAGLKSDAAVGLVSSMCPSQEVDRKNRNIWVTATTTDIDSDKEVVVASGADPKSRFFSLKNVFVDHQYDQGSFVGKMRRSMPVYGGNGDQTGWKVMFNVLPLSKSPFADDILTIAEEGGLTVSIGMEGLDYGKTTTLEKTKYQQGTQVPLSIVRKWNWLEMSTTMMPANLKCRQVGYGDDMGFTPSAEKRMDIFDNLLVKGRIKRATADAMGFSAIEQRRAGADLNARLNAPKFRGMLLVEVSP